MIRRYWMGGNRKIGIEEHDCIVESAFSKQSLRVNGAPSTRRTEIQDVVVVEVTVKDRDLAFFRQ